MASRSEPSSSSAHRRVSEETACAMSDMNSNFLWRNVLIAASRGLEYTFGAVAKALSGEVPVEVSGFSQDQDLNLEPSQSKKTGGRGEQGKKEKKEKRPPNAYNLFVAERVKELREAHPDAPNTDHFKQAAQDWKTSTKNKKNVGADSEVPHPAAEFAEAPKEAAAAAAEVSGGKGGTATPEGLGTHAQSGKKDKRRRKKEHKEDNAGAMGAHQAKDDGQATPEKRSAKKSKR